MEEASIMYEQAFLFVGNTTCYHENRDFSENLTSILRAVREPRQVKPVKRIPKSNTKKTTAS